MLNGIAASCAWGRLIIRQIFRLVICKQLGKTVSSRKIKTLARAVGIEKPLSVTLQQACRHWKAADEAYRALKKCAPMLQLDFLHDQSRDTQLTDSQRKQARMLLCNEKSRENYW